MKVLYNLLTKRVLLQFILNRHPLILSKQTLTLSKHYILHLKSVTFRRTVFAMQTNHRQIALFHASAANHRRTSILS